MKITECIRKYVAEQGIAEQGSAEEWDGSEVEGIRGKGRGSLREGVISFSQRPEINLIGVCRNPMIAYAVDF
jgi:hypothetical protein